MTTFTKAMIVALLIPGAALAQLGLGETAGHSEDAIVAFLTGQGYEVIETEIDGDEFEAEVSRDGIAYEVEVSLTTGRIVEIGLEDDDEDDDA